MGVLTDLQADIVSTSVSIGTVFRKALILAHRLKHEEFKTWVTMELDGYERGNQEFEEWLEKLPNYRKMRPLVRYDYISGYYSVTNMPFGGFFDEVPVNIRNVYIINGVAGLEKMVDTDQSSLVIHWPDYLVTIYNNKYASRGQVVSRIYNEISVIATREILETIRNRLLRFTLQLYDLDPELDDNPAHATELSSQLSNIYHITIMGGENVSVFNQSNQSLQGNQYNAAGDINFDAIANDNQFAIELMKLLPILQTELKHPEIDENIKLDAEYQLNKAIQETKASSPDKSKVLAHLKNVQLTVQGVTQIAGFALLVQKAIETIMKLHG